MVGKGSTRHNSRRFIAENIDRSRTSLNIEYCDENIVEVYHQLFDEALVRYNSKQKRDDRKIGNYYEKIRTGKQEKPFHEVILQIGNHLDTASASEEGELARKALDEYYRGFLERNKPLRVFSAHIHMDEATPHLHIDFVPYTTGSKRGLDTRVSLKQALGSLGFISTGKQDTEWSQWIEAEKSQLAIVMERYGIKRLDKGEHHEHLSVLNYKRYERAKEVAELSEQIEELQKSRESLESEISEKKEEMSDVKDELLDLTGQKEKISVEASEYYTSPEWRVPEPTAFMSVKKYIHDMIEPFVMKLKNVIGKLTGLVEYYKRSWQDANRNTYYYKNQAANLSKQNEKLKEDSEILDTIWQELGDSKINEILAQAEERQRAEEYEEDKPGRRDWDGPSL